jgi:hypothetical protein
MAKDKLSMYSLTINFLNIWFLFLSLINYLYCYFYGSTALRLALAAFLVSWTYTQSVGLLGRGISPSQGRYLHTEQHKHRINAHNTDIHASSGIQTHDSSIRASEDSLCLRPRGHYDRVTIFMIKWINRIPTLQSMIVKQMWCGGKLLRPMHNTSVRKAEILFHQKIPLFSNIYLSLFLSFFPSFLLSSVTLRHIHYLHHIVQFRCIAVRTTTYFTFIYMLSSASG